MNNRSDRLTHNILRLISMAFLLSLSNLSVSTLALQEEDEEIRRTRDERRFKDVRAGKRPTPQPASPRAQKPGEIRPAVAAAMDGELIGVTFWRLSPVTDERRSLSSATDEEEDGRIMIPTANGPTRPYQAARVSDNLTFSNGELLWLGIEVPQVDNCYVYVIDREQYADGTLSDPYLVFPAPTTPAGANFASAGSIVYVPAPGDPLPYLRLERNSARHVIERLTIIVSPHPLKFAGRLEELEPGVKLLKLDTSQFKERERQWSGKTWRLEARGYTGTGITRAEKEADVTRKLVPATGKEASKPRRLMPTDLLPQAIYEVEAKPGQPVLVHVPLRIARQR